MPHLYSHKSSGWRVHYRVYFSDGTHVDKARYAKQKAKAGLILREAGTLEDLSRRGTVTNDEIVFFINQKYITPEEAGDILSGAQGLALTWTELENKYADYSRLNCTTYTHSCNISRLKTILEHFTPDRIPSGVTETDVEDYLKERSSLVKSATLNKELHILRRLLDPLGDKNPARKVKPPKIKEERVPRPLWDEEILPLMKALRSHRKGLRGYFRAMALTSLYTGARPSEVVSLTRKDVNLDAGRIHIQAKDGYTTKTGKARSLDIHPKLAVHLRVCLRKGGKYLFGGDRAQLSKSFIRLLRMTMKEAELDGVTPYSLRHTFITRLLKTGAGLPYVMEAAGHRRLATTTRYLHVIPSDDSPLRRMSLKAAREQAKRTP